MADDARALLLRVLTAVLLALAPVVAVALSPWQAITGLVMLGLLPTLTATPSGPRAMLPAAAASTGVALLAVLAIGTGPLIPLVGTLLVVAHDLTLLREPVDVAVQTRMFDPEAYVGVEEIAAALAEADDWKIEVLEAWPRPSSAVSGHHVDDVVLRATELTD